MIGEDPSYVILALWAVNGLSVVCWVVAMLRSVVCEDRPTYQKSRSQVKRFSRESGRRWTDGQTDGRTDVR